MIRLTKISMSLLAGLVMALGSNAQTFVFDLSTGVGGTPMFPTSIAPTFPDDTWQVQLPSSAIVTPRVCATFAGWANSNCSSWISSHIDGSGNPVGTAPTGNYRYFTTFNLEDCCRNPEGALLRINSMGADNNIIGMEVNSNSYILNPPPANDFNPLIGASSINISGAHLVNGVNTLTIIVNNASIYTGFNFCGNLTVYCDYQGLPDTRSTKAPITEMEDSDAALHLFPNPSTGIFTLALANATEGTVDVFDVTGKKVRSLRLNPNTTTYQIDLAGYAKGIYTINITAGGRIQSKKVVLE